MYEQGETIKKLDEENRRLKLQLKRQATEQNVGWMSETGETRECTDREE